MRLPLARLLKYSADTRVAYTAVMQTLRAITPIHQRQTLMIDADDTLWENNIYFERAIEAFAEVVAHPELSAREVGERFDRFEATRIATHGYGVDAFHASLLAGFEHLTGHPCTAAHTAALADCAAHVRGADVELLQGVAQTLAALATRHTLVLVTKGSQAEQSGKLQRSGLERYFTHVEVLREKHAAAYADLLRRYHLQPASTWMIGNSPRSDVNPALAAGMHAVYLPHPSTWVLEQEVLANPRVGQTLLQLNSFAELLQRFG